MPVLRQTLLAKRNKNENGEERRMLTVSIPLREFYDEATEEFITLESRVFKLEHSLVSLSKWEMKWCKPFMGKEQKTDEETLDYIRCMMVDEEDAAGGYANIPDDVLTQIYEYINAPMTATWFNERDTRTGINRKVITAEIIYYYMITLNIPMECQNWHLNRLITLIKVCSIKNAPPKKRGQREMYDSRRALNEARCAKLNTSG
jgi:hypothetical protein